MPIIIIERRRKKTLLIYNNFIERVSCFLSLSCGTPAHTHTHHRSNNTREKKCRPRIKSFSPRSTHRGDSYTASSLIRAFCVCLLCNKLKLINLQRSEQMSGCVLVQTRLFYAHLIYITVRITTPLKILSHRLVYTRWHTNLTLASASFFCSYPTNAIRPNIRWCVNVWMRALGNGVWRFEKRYWPPAHIPNMECSIAKSALCVCAFQSTSISPKNDK